MFPFLLSLDHRTGGPYLHIPCYMPLHAWAPITMAQVSIHLCGSMRDQEPRLVRLFHHCLPDLARKLDPKPSCTGSNVHNYGRKFVCITFNPLLLPIFLLDSLGLSLLDQLQKWAVNEHPQKGLSARSTSRLAAQSVDDHVFLPWIVKNLIIIIIDHIN